VSQHEQRRLELQLNEHGATLTSTANAPRSDGSVNQMRFEIGDPTGSGNTDGSLSLRVRYYHDTAQAQPQTQATLRVAFVSVIEFEERTSPFNGFTQGVDTVVRQLNLDTNTGSWQFQRLPDVVQSDGSVMTSFAARYRNGSQFSMELRSCTSEFQSAGTTFPPGTLKIDVKIPDFAYAKNTTHLALMAKVQSGSPISVQGQQTQVQTQDGSKASFAWEGSVSSKGGSGAVLASQFTDCNGGTDPKTLTTELAKQTYFSFSLQNAKGIVWDPSIFATDDPTNFGCALSFSFLLAVLSLFALLL
jgi:hypothetical protein